MHHKNTVVIPAILATVACLGGTEPARQDTNTEPFFTDATPGTKGVL